MPYSIEIVLARSRSRSGSSGRSNAMHDLLRTRGPGEHRLRRVAIAVFDLVELALALGPAAPVGQAAVDRDDQVAARRDAGVGGEHVQDGEQLVLGDVSARRLGQLRAEELAPRIAGDQRIAGPVRRAEGRAAVDRFVEVQAAGRLVLRAVVEDARLVDHRGKVPRMPRREAVMPLRLDVQQLVERVAVGEPGRPFLVGREQVAQAVEGQRDREANPGGDDLALAEVGRDLSGSCRARPSGRTPPGPRRRPDRRW